MGFAEMMKVIESSQNVNPNKRNVYNKKPISKETNRSTASTAKTNIGDWVTTLKLTNDDYKAGPQLVPVLSGKIGNIPRLKRRGSPDSARTEISMLSISSRGSPALVRERINVRRRRTTRPEKRLDWETFLRARKILIDELLQNDGEDKDADMFLESITSLPSDSIERSSVALDCSQHVPPKIILDKACLSPVIESASKSEAPSPDEVSLPELSSGRNATPTKGHRSLPELNSAKESNHSHAHTQGRDSPTYRFLSSVSPTSMCFSSPCPSLKHNKEGVPDFERHVTLKVRKRILMTTFELNRMTGYGDPDSVYVASADSDWLRFTDEDYSKIPRIPQRFRVAPQLSRVIRQDIRYKTGRPCYRKLKERDLSAFEREKLKEMTEETFKELCIFHWLVDIDEDKFEDVGSEIVEQKDRPKTRSASQRRSSLAYYTQINDSDIFDVGIPM
ncbi:uncharacterized protein LOC135489955 [Lineus longissimus]|uniref:uncharacterized protein LOC135489955 n=1 Tax=Lineus longissimus TaxID=88925 RepID=UPI00315D0AD2